MLRLPIWFAYLFVCLFVYLFGTYLLLFLSFFFFFFFFMFGSLYLIVFFSLLFFFILSFFFVFEKERKIEKHKSLSLSFFSFS